KRNSELYRRNRDTAFNMRATLVEALNLATPPLKIARPLQLIPNIPNAMRMFHRLLVMRRIALAIQVAFADQLRTQPQSPRRLVQNLLDCQHSLRSAESTKRRL